MDRAVGRRVWGILIVAAGLLLWGAVHAVGAYRASHHLGRALMIFGAVLGFLVFWFVLLLAFRRRLNRRSSKVPPPSSPHAE